MVWRCHGIPCVYFYFLFKTTLRKVTFSTIARHIENSILKDTLELKILRTCINLRANNSLKVEVALKTWRCLENYHLQKGTTPNFKANCTKIDDFFSITYCYSFFFSQSNLVFKSNPVFIDIVDSFCYSLFTFLPFDYWYSTEFEFHPVPQFFFKNQ